MTDKELQRLADKDFWDQAGDPTNDADLVRGMVIPQAEVAWPKSLSQDEWECVSIEGPEDMDPVPEPTHFSDATH